MALTHSGFAAEFQSVRHALWVVALAVLGGSGGGGSVGGGRALRLHADAEDVVQEAAVVALGKLDQFEPGTSFVAWMSQIVRHIASNARHKTQRRRTFATDFREVDVVAPRGRDIGPGGAALGNSSSVSTFGQLSVEQTNFDDAVVQALEDLDESARACMLLRGVSGLSYREISAILGVPEGTAMSHVHRSRRLLRERLLAGKLPSIGTGGTEGSTAAMQQGHLAEGKGKAGGTGGDGANGGSGGVVGGQLGISGTGVSG